MKTLKQIRNENPYMNVFYTIDFKVAVDYGEFSEYDGIGYFHNGEKQTNISVWNAGYKDWEKYPYIIWYNK